jgi:16S rRNA (uracil1498-N3)-methyltransferase
LGGRAAHRVYVDADLEAGRDLTVTGSAGNHIARVLRLRMGESLRLFNGRGGDYAGRIERVHRDGVVVSVGEHRPLEHESPCHLTLAQGISRGERMDWVIQKATELGVSRIVPLFTDRSVVHLDATQAARKLQHWRAIAIAACEQSGRNRLPEITSPVALAAIVENTHETGNAILLSPGAALRVVDLPGGATRATVLVGPEGGLAESEQALALRAGFTPVRIGPRVLRTETAAVCALTLLQQKFGDL